MLAPSPSRRAASTSPSAHSARCRSSPIRLPCCSEVCRVLRPGGRFAFSVSHPMRWMFPDDPGPGGLTVASSYFDRTPYVETSADGQPTYVEHHRTVGDWVADIASGRVRADQAGRARMAGRPHRKLGRLVAAARASSCRARRSSCAISPAARPPGLSTRCRDVSSPAPPTPSVLPAQRPEQQRPTQQRRVRRPTCQRRCRCRRCSSCSR